MVLWKSLKKEYIMVRWAWLYLHVGSEAVFTGDWLGTGFLVTAPAMDSEALDESDMLGEQRTQKGMFENTE